MKPSIWRNYDDDPDMYRFSSYDIFLDQNILNIERRFFTLMDLIVEIGGLSRGLVIIAGLILLAW